MENYLAWKLSIAYMESNKLFQDINRMNVNFNINKFGSQSFCIISLQPSLYSTYRGCIIAWKKKKKLGSSE